MSGSPNTTNRLPAPVFFSSRHAQVLVHARLQHPQPAEVQGLVADMGLEGEAADDQHVEQVRRLARGLEHVRLGDGAVFGADEDRGAPLLALLLVAPLGMHEAARPRLQARELQPLALLGVLHARGLQVLEHDADEIVLAVAGLAVLFGTRQPCAAAAARALPRPPPRAASPPRPRPPRPPAARGAATGSRP